MKYKLLTVFCLCLFLTGCRQDSTEELKMRMVSQIQVQFSGSEPHVYRSYGSPRQLSQVLTLLRPMVHEPDRHHPPVEPLKSSLKITLLYQNGEIKRFRLHQDRYLCSDAFSWKAISPEQAQKLQNYILKTPSDQSFQKGSEHSPHLPARDLNCNS